MKYHAYIKSMCDTDEVGLGVSLRKSLQVHCFFAFSSFKTFNCLFFILCVCTLVFCLHIGRISHRPCWPSNYSVIMAMQLLNQPQSPCLPAGKLVHYKAPAHSPSLPCSLQEAAEFNRCVCVSKTIQMCKLRRHCPHLNICFF